MKTSNDKSNGYLIIIVCLLIFLTILCFYAINTFGKIGFVPTGNVDIFQINCKKDEDNICDDSLNDDSVKVFDKNISWNSNSELRIFTNPAYEFKNVIAPGTSNSYQFVILNNEKYNIKYSLRFIEENEHGINMQFKLRKNKEYILGDSNTWKTIDDISTLEYELQGNEHDVYLLDWKWLNHNNDTDVSFKEANYKLSINIKATV